MTAIITAILPLVLTIVNFIFKFGNFKAEQKKSWYEFLGNMEPHSKTCVRLRKDYQAQIDAIMAKNQAVK